MATGAHGHAGMDEPGRGHGALHGQAPAQVADRGVGDVEDFLGLHRVLAGPVAEDHVDDLHEAGCAQGVEDDHGRGDDAHQFHGFVKGVGQQQDQGHVHDFPAHGQARGPAPVHAAFLEIKGQQAGDGAFDHGGQAAGHGAESADVDEDAVSSGDEPRGDALPPGRRRVRP